MALEVAQAERVHRKGVRSKELYHIPSKMTIEHSLCLTLLHLQTGTEPAHYI